MAQARLSILPSDTPKDSINKNTGVVQPKLKTVLFGHHPCPDGITALVSLQKKFGTTNASYVGFNHAKPDDMRKTIYSAIGDQPVNIIFADIMPPFNILKELLENTKCTITILDHHETAIKEIESNKEYLSEFISRLQMVLDQNRSGASIAYDYAQDSKSEAVDKYPPHVSLVQAMDRFTATSDINILKEFDAKAIDLDSQSSQLMIDLASLTTNKQIKDNIEFYVLAGILDVQLKQLYKDSNFKVDNVLMESAKKYFDFIEKFGFAKLLKEKNIYAEFKSQLSYQADAIDKAVVIPSGISDKFDILFIEANIQTGRTFDALIEARLNSLPRPAIAVIVDTKNISDNNNWASLRAAGDEFNLSQIAFEYKGTGKALNAGGHPRASAMQLSKDQLLVFKNQSACVKKIRSSSLARLSVFSVDSSQVDVIDMAKDIAQLEGGSRKLS